MQFVGRTLFHPLLVSPEDTEIRDFVNIDMFERDAKLMSVLNRMKSLVKFYYI